MNKNTRSELTVEQVCVNLTVARDELIGGEGESIAMVQMFDAELFGRVVGGKLESVKLNDGGVYLVLELPFGYHFPLQSKGELEDGFTPIDRHGNG